MNPLNLLDHWGPELVTPLAQVNLLARREVVVRP